MARHSKIRKPTAAEIQQIQQLIETSLDKRQRRRAEILLLYVAGLAASAIARLLTAVVLQLLGDEG